MKLARTKLINEKKSLGYTLYFQHILLENENNPVFFAEFEPLEGNRETSLQVDTRFDCFRLVFVRRKEDRGRLIYEVFYAGMISFTCMDFNK
ncbi:hypothetical protein V6N12_041850 [Hibiscus sabdariffa]|uniref:Uncharacterized protein n=1 Tax=Hibiscus sabdariffa TaxID=183260 RepID=A0ABR2ED32_9ROSI